MRSIVIAATVLFALAVGSEVLQCTSTSHQNITCAAGDSCCSGWTPLCFDPKTSRCCNNTGEVSVCPSNTDCCASQNGPDTCCGAGTSCCGGMCCESGSEQCCSTWNNFCCAKDAVCCSEFCCGPDQVCCGGQYNGDGVCCDKSNQICNGGTCAYITPPPSYHPAPYANWSTVWSLDAASLGSCITVAKGIVCTNTNYSNYSDPITTVQLLSPQDGSVQWTNAFDNTSNVNPIMLSDTLLFIGTSLVNVTSGAVLWQETASSACLSQGSGTPVFLDGASNVILSCGTREDNGHAMLIYVFGLYLGNGSTRFTYTHKLTVEQGGLVAVAQHTAVIQGQKQFIALNTLTGEVAWRHTFSEDSATVFPAQTAFVFTSGTSATATGVKLSALHYSSGTELWSMPNPGAGAYTLVVKIKRSVEVIASLNNVSTLQLIEVRTGVVVFQTPNWPSFSTPPATTFASNSKYLWGYSNNITAVSLDDLQVAWSVPVTWEASVTLYPGSANNREVYVRDYQNALVKLSASGEVLHKWSILPASLDSLGQYDAEKVVVVISSPSIIAFSIQ